MPRVPRRLIVEFGSTHQCTFQSHNFMPLFDDEAVAEKFLELLARHKKKHGILIHSYCLMSAEPYIVLTARKGQKAFSRFWKVVNQGLAHCVNRRLGRRGQVVMERLRSPQIMPDDGQLLTVMRYNDLGPVRGGQVPTATQWKYSSYRHYAFGEENPLIDDPPAYLALGQTPAERRKAYLHLFAEPLAPLLNYRAEFHRGAFIGFGEWLRCRLEWLAQALASWRSRGKARAAELAEPIPA